MSKDVIKEIFVFIDVKECSKVIEIVMSQIEKVFGKGLIMKLGVESKFDVQVVSIGSFSFDFVLGVGGILCGCIIEIYGFELGGKIILVFVIVVQVQKVGGICVFIDVEYVFDLVYVCVLGVNIDELLVLQFDNGEQVFEIMELLVCLGVIDVVVVDLVVVLIFCVEIEGDMGDSLFGFQVCLMLQVLCKLMVIFFKIGIVVIFINQVCEKIGVMYGNFEIIIGGWVLKFYVSVCFDVCKIGQFIKVGNDVVVNIVKIKIVKNKVVVFFKEVEFVLVYGKGFDQFSDFVGLVVDMDIIKKVGSFYFYGDECIGQGKEKIIVYIVECFEMEQEICDCVMVVICVGNVGEVLVLVFVFVVFEVVEV